MKKLLIFCGLMMLMACQGFTYKTSDTSRNQIYYGQSVVDLFDNFGTPTKAEKYNYGVIGYIFMHEQIIKERVDNKLKYCDLRVFTRNNHVIDWDWQGNNCQFEVDKETKFTLFEDIYQEEE